MTTIQERKMTDIHMHLIPGVDDGAEDEQMALLMLLRAKDQGIRAVFATPHSSAFDEEPEGTKDNVLFLILFPLFSFLSLCYSHRNLKIKNF